MKKIWAPNLKEAHNGISALKSKPKAIVLHVGTNDLAHASEEFIVKSVLDIFSIVNARGIKFIWSNVIPRGDDIDLNGKACVINALITRDLAKRVGAYISRNDNFYDNDVFNAAIYDDGVHLLKEGTSILAQNTRRTVCRCLNKEFVTVKKPNRKNDFHHQKRNPYKR